MNIIQLYQKKKPFESNFYNMEKENTELVKDSTAELDVVKEEMKKLDLDTESDYQYARDKIKKLIDRSEDALNLMFDLAESSDHPRSYEVLTQMFKNSGDLMEQLLRLQEKRKSLLKHEENSSSEENKGVTNNNAIFVGSTTELQKFLTNKD